MSLKVLTKAAQVDSEGKWAKHDSGAEFLIARAGNIKFLNSIDRYERPHRKARARGTLSTATEIEIQCRSMAEGILLGWRGLVDESGKPVEYDSEMAYQVLRHNPDIREFVTDFSTELQNFRKEELDDEAKK